MKVKLQTITSNPFYKSASAIIQASKTPFDIKADEDLGEKGFYVLLTDYIIEKPSDDLSFSGLIGHLTLEKMIDVSLRDDDVISKHALAYLSTLKGYDSSAVGMGMIDSDLRNHHIERMSLYVNALWNDFFALPK